jgi:flavodoxin/ferredoxin
MKSIVIYDSYTGNTKKIAYAIHTGMNRVAEQCDIARLREVNWQGLVSYDLIGLGSPVFEFRELANVTNFIEHYMESLEGKHAFAFCTHGASMGHYLSRVVPAMMQRGLVVIGWNDWYGAAHYPFFPKPYITDGHPDAIDLKEAEDFGTEMVLRSRRIYQGETQLIPAFPKGRDYDEIYGSVRQFLEGEIDKELRRAQSSWFKVNTEKCNYPKCTFCIDICPMKAIDFSVSPPVFTFKCDKCWHCEQTCPRGAIEVDWNAYKKILDQRVTEMLEELEETMEKAEAKGRFRRLVPRENIGSTPLCRSKNPPRYKLDR